ncbi:hypothetical protein PILCRDRAFT_813243 [Piloderma croceum F 1598]|uniref:BTB domain-containing protein n=1 Tax=Piloderma croceum (strain F 1598) TaxID=765440 RepID=A0A0C3GC58_PILCF|nr:hypothetical protein PILCRDRAFT_813243 [Piloderma croceum F 1598]
MTNPLKRARNETTDESDTSTIKITECTRHSDVWFDDGSIVLCVEKTLFRVHRTILCSHSEIFSDMFSLPRPLDEHMIEGCPVAWLSDRACDVEHLLKAMYDPFFRPTLMSTDQLEGVLRLSTKYEMPTFRQECISYITSCFPSELSDFDDPPPRPSCFWAVTMARECDILEILPCAMYLCAREPPRVIIEGGDGDSRNCLSQGDQNLCWEAREQLAHMAESEVFSFLYRFQPHSECQAANKCRSGARGIIRIFYETNRIYPYGRMEALRIEDFSIYGKSVCGCCLTAMRTSHHTGRQVVWAALPNLFGLGSWNNIFPPDLTESLSDG